LGAIFAGPRRRLASMRPRLPNRDAMARAGTLGTGIVIGALLGAGLALIFAPQSGEETRAVMRRSARGARLRATDAWDGLADELHFAARRTGRRVARAKRRVRYVAEDVLGDRMPERFSRRG
jgi:gas vesicle protein